MSSWKCKKCESIAIYDEGYDSFFCFMCNLWNEDACTDEECLYCSERPENPLTEAQHELCLIVARDHGKDFARMGIDQFLNGE